MMGVLCQDYDRRITRTAGVWGCVRSSRHVGYKLASQTGQDTSGDVPLRARAGSGNWRMTRSCAGQLLGRVAAAGDGYGWQVRSLMVAAERVGELLFK